MRTYPFSEPDFISARKRSPALRLVNPNCSTILAHWVPFPLPGPPANQQYDGKLKQKVLKEKRANM